MPCPAAFRCLRKPEDGFGGARFTVQNRLVVIVVGFFVTLILAWYHGEKGRQRVSGPELLMVAAVLVVGGVGWGMEVVRFTKM